MHELALLRCLSLYTDFFAHVPCSGVVRRAYTGRHRGNSPRSPSAQRIDESEQNLRKLEEQNIAVSLKSRLEVTVTIISRSP
jgi:hypothetical protein